MKTPSNELFVLIKSLSSHEKRDFKLFAGKKATYIQLFDTINSNKNNAKGEISINSKTTKVKNKKRIKSYLYKALIKFLEHRYSEYSIEIQLQRFIQLTEILISKQLLLAAKKIVLKAEKIALENHQYLYLLTILSWKRRITIRTENIKEHDEYDEKQYKNELLIIDLYKNLLEYQKLKISVGNMLISKSFDINSETKTKLSALLKNPFLKKESMALSPMAKALCYFILGDIHLMLKNWQKSYASFQQVLNYFESAKLGTNDKLTVYSRLTTILRKLKRQDELITLKSNIVLFYKSIPKKNQTVSLHSLYLSTIVNYINYQTSTLNIKEALLECDKIKEYIEKYSSKQLFLVYYANKLLLHFYLGEYRKSLICANKVELMTRDEVREDIYSDVKIFSLIIHFELGNLEMLPVLCKSYLKQENTELHKSMVKNILLNFFAKKIHEKNVASTYRKSRILLFMKLKKELEPHKKEYIYTQFDFTSWAESKIQNRSMIDVLREKS